MNVTPLALHSPGAVREALRFHGWEEGLARASAGGIQPLAFHLTGLSQQALEALVHFGGNLGLGDEPTTINRLLTTGILKEVEAILNNATTPQQRRTELGLPNAFQGARQIRLGVRYIF